MGDTLKITPDYLRDLKTQVNNLLDDIESNDNINKLANWSTVPFGASTWDEQGDGGGAGTGGVADKILAGSSAFVPAAKMQEMGTTYAGSAVNFVNWLTDVLKSISTNIDNTLSSMSDAEGDNEVSAQKLQQEFGQTIANLGGTPPQQTGYTA